ncbi:MAG: DUF2796 domain-containing protein [Thalassovita sp.]
MKHSLSILALLAAMPAFAEETRHADAHEHGVGTLNIALDGAAVAMAFEAPGADIVGFEYAAQSAADHAAIDAALIKLATPTELFVFPQDAGCEVSEAFAALEGEAHHEEHEAHEEHEEHEAHDDHDKHDDHEEHHDHDDHEDHDAHEEDAGHTEFHAEYMLTCATPEALDRITFDYFATFPNALEVDVQILTSAGAQAFEVTKDAPVLKLER